MKKNSLKGFLVLLLVSAQIAAYGQQVEKPVKQKSLPQSDQIIYKSTPNSDGIIRCHTMEMDSIMRAQNPSMPSLREDEIWLQNKIQEFKAQQAANGAAGLAKATLLTIPVVVHVIHNGDAVGSGENIADGQVLSQIQVMNEDFRKMLGTNGYNTHPDGADIEIEFCLAVVDPTGSPTDGIDRVNYGTASFTSTGAVDAMKTNTFWNPDDYMNMWTVRFGGGAAGLLGYAQFPNSSGLGGLNVNNGNANTDGVVAVYNGFGSQTIYPAGTYMATYNLGRTMTHEVGHYLGLRHIWGDANCGNDFCGDTPESTTSNYNCVNQTTCDGIQDMVENYMDYTNDACMNIFTEDQKTRIRTVMTVSPRRASLALSTACQSPNPDNAGVSAITGADGDICGSTIDPVITITNYGNNNLTSVTVDYDLDGGASTTVNWTGNLAPGATDDIIVPTMSPAAGPHVFNASTSMPNGVADTDPANDANSTNFTIIVGGQLVTLDLTTDCWGYEQYWELLDATSAVVYSGGNTGTTIPPGGGQTAAPGETGSYGNETTYTENWCLTDGCYDFFIYDDWGDGSAGVASGCGTDGNYVIYDASSTVIAAMGAADWGNSATHNFCTTPPCLSTYSNSTTEELCNGDDDGSIDVAFITGNASGATYDIGSGTQASGTFTNLPQGNYTVTIVDGDACTTYLDITLGGPAALVANMAVNDISCNGLTDGQVIVTTTGGTPTMTYDIGAGPVGSGTFTGLSAGPYTVDVLDGNGCPASANGTVVEPTVLMASTGTISPELFGNDGGITTNVSGGSPNYTYAWTGTGGYTSTAASPSNMPGGTYDVTITDASGCTTTITGIVVPSELGIDEFGNTQFVIYPNPSNGVFNVQLFDAVDYTLTIVDIAGRIVYSKSNSSENTFVVDLTEAANGTYMMSVQTETQILTKRIVLKK